MKKHSMFKVTMITLLFIVVATWFLPITEIQQTSTDTFSFVTSETEKVGLFTLFNNLSTVFGYFFQHIIYVLAVGGLYGVLHKIPQYRVLLDKIANGFKNCEWLFMIIVGVVFALLSSLAGLSLPLLVLFPFVISVILLMGYDKVTAAMLTVGSVISGLIGSAYSVNDAYGLSYYMGFAPDQKVELKMILLFVSLALVILNTILYGRKHRDKDHLVKGFFIPEKVPNCKKNISALVVILDTMLIVLALGFISWNFLGVTLFDNLAKELATPTAGSTFEWFFNGANSILGIDTAVSTDVMGNWSTLQASLVVIVTSGLLAFAYRKKFNNYLRAFGEGALKALKPALLVAIIYTTLVTVVNIPVLMSIAKLIMNLDGKFSFIIMCIVALFFSLFTVESYYGVGSAMSYISTVLTATNTAIIALIWQSMYGFAMLFAPTSVILVVTLSYLDVSYGKWMKAIWQLLLELLVALVILLLIFSAL